MSRKLLLAASAAVLLNASPALAASDAELEALRAEIAAMKQVYEAKIATLEERLDKIQAIKIEPAAGAPAPAPATAPATAARRVGDNSFNPATSVILNGRASAYSSNEPDIAGFAVGHEGERPDEGLRIDETELNFSASVDDKFRGSATLALHQHDGDIEIEIEEAFVETTALPHGFNVRAGRFFAPLGYLNEQHAHTDDFADRPLTNRVFLDKQYNDDGVEVSWVLPTSFYTEIGGGAIRGDDFPAGGATGHKVGAWNAYARTGGDVGDDLAWRAGLSTLLADDVRRHGEGLGGNEIDFDGRSNLYVADLRLSWAPDGNIRERQLILQGEYFRRYEDGAYEDDDAGLEDDYDDHQSGWYAQGVYKFHPQWRAGGRYSRLNSGSVPAGLAGSGLDGEGHNPWAASAMIDWSNSEFSRLRLQYNRERPSQDERDSQIILQYIMSIGAHGAHPF